MSVHKRKDGRWYIQYRDGAKLKQEYFGRGPEAKTKAIELNADKEGQENHSPSGVVRPKGGLELGGT
jgi:hypothetical protein